jgi:hypothetical protein
MTVTVAHTATGRLFRAGGSYCQSEIAARHRLARVGQGDCCSMVPTGRTLPTLPEGRIVTSNNSTPPCVRMPPRSDNSGVWSRIFRGGAGRSLAETHSGEEAPSRALDAGCERAGGAEIASDDPVARRCSAGRPDALRQPGVATRHTTPLPSASASAEPGNPSPRCSIRHRLVACSCADRRARRQRDSGKRWTCVFQASPREHLRVF